MLEKILEEIEKMSGRYSPSIVFSDWVQCSAIAIQNTCSIDDDIKIKREKEYVNVIGKYDAEETKMFANMLGMLTIELEENPRDVLGEIYMESGAGSKQTGQFFTPFHISQLCSDIALQVKHNKDGDYIINEPSCGGGGMIVASLNTMKKRGISRRKVKIIAQDLDWNGVYMTYVQLSLLGVDAIVAQGDTLKEPYIDGYSRERVFYTPARMGLII